MFLILTVIYNKTTVNSDTLKGIMESADLLNEVGAMLLLHDNSTIRLNSGELLKLKSVIEHLEYQHTPENLPLSKIYNNTIQKGLLTPQLKYLVLLDDDSKIDKEFFKKAIEGAAGKHSLMIPVIKNQRIIRSPMISYTIKTSVLSTVNPGLIASKNMMAINSGMVISFEFLRSTRFQYDKRLTNYGTDNYFMKFYSTYSKNIFILDYMFNHSLSFFDSTDMSKKLKVFSQNKKASLIINSDNLFNYCQAFAYNVMSSIKNSVKYRSLKFLK
jgi:hypothetical protein